MKQIVFFIALLLLIGGCSSKEKRAITHKVPAVCDYYSLQSAECLDKKSFIDDVEPYEVIFVGDYHNSSNARKVVLELIDGLSHRGYKIALANEWFTPSDNALLKQYTDGELDSNISNALGWKQRVSFDFNLSEPIYNSVINNQGKLYGINMSKEFKKMVSDQNLSAMNAEERVFFDSLDLNVSAHQQMLAPFFSHCHHLKNGESQEQCSERMYRVQVAWDSMMGEESARLAEGLKEKEKLIVFVGAMHLASGLGANLRFNRMSNKPSITILPMVRETKEKKDIAVELGCCDILYLYND